MKWLVVLRRHWVAVVAGLGVLGALASVLAVVASQPLRDYLYRDLSYILITKRIVGDERDPERMALRLNEYVAENVYPGGGAVIDFNSWNDLVRGIGWCDQDAWTLSTLLATRDISGRMVFLEGEGGRPQHTVAEVLLDGEWRVFDPLYDFTYRRGDVLATFDQLAADPSATVAHPIVQALPDPYRTNLGDFLLRLYSNPDGAEQWSSLLDERYGSLPRYLVREALRTYLAVFGDWGANRFQDLHLALLPDRVVALDEVSEKGNRPIFRSETEDPALYMYHRARNYHLYARADQAERLYAEIQARYPDSWYAEKSAYFIGLSQFRVRRQPRAALEHLSAFLERYPDSAWMPLAHDLMGAIYEQLGDIPRAIEHYEVARPNQWLKAATRLAALRPVAAVATEAAP